MCVWAWSMDYSLPGSKLSLGMSPSHSVGVFTYQLADDNGWPILFILITPIYFKEILWTSPNTKRLICLHQHDHSITMKLIHKRNSENDMKWPKYTSNFNNFQTHEVFLKDKNSQLMIIRSIGQYLSSRLRFFKKNKCVREFTKDYFQLFWFSLSRNNFSWLFLVLSNQHPFFFVPRFSVFDTISSLVPYITFFTLCSFYFRMLNLNLEFGPN